MNPDTAVRSAVLPDETTISVLPRSYRCWLNTINTDGSHTLNEVILPGQPSYGYNNNGTPSDTTDDYMYVNNLPNRYITTTAVGSNQVLRIPQVDYTRVKTYNGSAWVVTDATTLPNGVRLAPAWRWELSDASVYPERSSTAQHDESDLDFVLRLMSEEGLVAWWEHTGDPSSPVLGQHTLVFADHAAAMNANRQASVRFTGSDHTLGEDSLTTLHGASRIASQGVELTSRDYRSGGASALGHRPVSAHGGDPLAVFDHSVIDHPGLYAYESMAGVRITQGALATQDVDLLWDASRRVEFMADLQRDAGSILAVLHKVDPSFQRRDDALRNECAINDKGFEVEFLRREVEAGDVHPFRFSDDDGDLWPVQARRAAVLAQSPLFSHRPGKNAAAVASGLS